MANLDRMLGVHILLNYSSIFRRKTISTLNWNNDERKSNFVYCIYSCGNERSFHINLLHPFMGIFIHTLTHSSLHPTLAFSGSASRILLCLIKQMKFVYMQINCACAFQWNGFFSPLFRFTFWFRKNRSRWPDCELKFTGRFKSQILTFQCNLFVQFCMECINFTHSQTSKKIFGLVWINSSLLFLWAE